MSKPRIHKGPASRYGMDGEAIVELWAPGLKVGCLLSLREHDGKLIIEPYRADKNVVVRVNAQDITVPA